jgi:hypothetical protein
MATLACTFEAVMLSGALILGGLIVTAGVVFVWVKVVTQCAHGSALHGDRGAGRGTRWNTALAPALGVKTPSSTITW